MISEKKISPLKPLSDSERRLLDKVGEKEEELIKLLSALVRIDSTNISEYEFCDRREIFNFAESWIEDAGIGTELYKAPFPDENGEKFYPNLIASLDSGSPGKTLQYCGHLDIVPYNEANWDPATPPLGGVVKDGKLFGRGSADMKAGVACQMMAMKILSESGMLKKGRLQMWFTPDEETHGAYGSSFMPEKYPEAVKADATIISEPTGLAFLNSPAVITGEKGPCWLRFTFFGVAGHGSMPKQKSNALNKAARFINRAEKELKFPRRRVSLTPLKFFTSLLRRYSLKDISKINFSSGSEPNPLNKDKASIKSLYRTSVSFNRIQAGVKTNVIPDTCTLEADFRLMPRISEQDLFDALVNYSGRLGYKVKLPEGFPNPQETNSRFSKEPVDIRIDLITAGNGSIADPSTEFGRTLAEAYEAVYETRPMHILSPGFTDAGNMREAGLKDIFVVGPGGANPHEANEYADLTTLKDTVKLNILTAIRYLN